MVSHYLFSLRGMIISQLFDNESINYNKECITILHLDAITCLLSGGEQRP